MEPTNASDAPATGPTTDETKEVENKSHGCCSKKQGKEDARCSRKSSAGCCIITVEPGCCNATIVDRAAMKTSRLQWPRKCVDLCSQGCCVTILYGGKREKICLTMICTMGDKRCCSVTAFCCEKTGIARDCCKPSNATGGSQSATPCNCGCARRSGENSACATVGTRSANKTCCTSPECSKADGSNGSNEGEQKSCNMDLKNSGWDVKGVEGKNCCSNECCPLPCSKSGDNSSETTGYREKSCSDDESHVDQNYCSKKCSGSRNEDGKPGCGDLKNSSCKCVGHDGESITREDCCSRLVGFLRCCNDTANCPDNCKAGSCVPQESNEYRIDIPTCCDSTGAMQDSQIPKNDGCCKSACLCECINDLDSKDGRCNVKGSIDGKEDHEKKCCCSYSVGDNKKCCCQTNTRGCCIVVLRFCGSVMATEAEEDPQLTTKSGCCKPNCGCECNNEFAKCCAQCKDGCCNFKGTGDGEGDEKTRGCCCNNCDNKYYCQTNVGRCCKVMIKCCCDVTPTCCTSSGAGNDSQITTKDGCSIPDCSTDCQCGCNKECRNACCDKSKPSPYSIVKSKCCGDSKDGCCNVKGCVEGKVASEHSCCCCSCTVSDNDCCCQNNNAQRCCKVVMKFCCHGKPACCYPTGVQENKELTTKFGSCKPNCQCECNRECTELCAECKDGCCYIKGNGDVKGGTEKSRCTTCDNKSSCQINVGGCCKVTIKGCCNNKPTRCDSTDAVSDSQITTKESCSKTDCSADCQCDCKRDCCNPNTPSDFSIVKLRCCGNTNDKCCNVESSVEGKVASEKRHCYCCKMRNDKLCSRTSAQGCCSMVIKICCMPTCCYPTGAQEDPLLTRKDACSKPNCQCVCSEECCAECKDGYSNANSTEDGKDDPKKRRCCCCSICNTKCSCKTKVGGCCKVVIKSVCDGKPTCWASTDAGIDPQITTKDGCSKPDSCMNCQCGCNKECTNVCCDKSTTLPFSIVKPKCCGNSKDECSNVEGCVEGKVASEKRHCCCCIVSDNDCCCQTNAQGCCKVVMKFCCNGKPACCYPTGVLEDPELTTTFGCCKPNCQCECNRECTEFCAECKDGRCNFNSTEDRKDNPEKRRCCCCVCKNKCSCKTDVGGCCKVMIKCVCDGKPTCCDSTDTVKYSQITRNDGCCKPVCSTDSQCECNEEYTNDCCNSNPQSEISIVKSKCYEDCKGGCCNVKGIGDGKVDPDKRRCCCCITSDKKCCCSTKAGVYCKVMMEIYCNGKITCHDPTGAEKDSQLTPKDGCCKSDCQCDCNKGYAKCCAECKEGSCNFKCREGYSEKKSCRCCIICDNECTCKTNLRNCHYVMIQSCSNQCKPSCCNSMSIEMDLAALKDSCCNATCRKTISLTASMLHHNY